jgi:ELWxxDGT repeat protein
LENRIVPSVSAHLLKDLNLQPASSNPNGFITIGAVTYFSADDRVHGRELWRTDGTKDGTFLLKDTDTNGSGDPWNLVNLNGELLFTAGAYANQLWESDGTSGGIRLLKTFNTTLPPNGRISAIKNADL